MSRAINSSMLHNGCARYSFRVRPNDLFIRTGRATSISRICSLSSGLQHDQYIKNVGAFTSTSRSRNLTTFAPASAGSAIVSPTSSQEIDINVDTIYALSTGAGVRAGIAIVRISGPACLPVSFLRFSDSNGPIILPHQMASAQVKVNLHVGY